MMDSWRHHQRQLQQQKAPSPMLKTGGQYIVSGVNVTPSGGESYQNAHFNSLSAVERTNPFLISERCCTEIHPPPPLKRPCNLQSQQTPVGHLSEQVVLPTLEQQFFSGYNPSYVRECSRTVSSEYVIKYQDGSALKAGFSYHEPSCKCQECVTRLLPLHSEFDNKRLDSVSKPVYLGDKDVYAEQTIFPKPVGISDEQYIPVQSSFSKPADIKNESYVTLETGVSKPPVHSDVERIAMWSGVSKPSDINNEVCIAMKSGVSKPSVCSDPQPVAMWLGVSKPAGINNEGCVTIQTGVSKPSVPSDLEHVAKSSDVSKPTDINSEGYITMKTEVSKPSVCSDPQPVAMWLGVSKPAGINNEGCVTIQTGVSKPSVPSDLEHVAKSSDVSKPTDINSEGYITMQTGVSKPSVRSDVERVATWSGVSKPKDINTEGYITMQTGVSNPCVRSDPELGAVWSDAFKPSSSGSQPNVSEHLGASEPAKQNDLVSVIRLWKPPDIDSNRLVTKQSSASILDELSNKEKHVAQSSISESNDLSNRGYHVIPSNFYIPSDYIDREAFLEQSGALKSSNRECLTVEPTEKGNSVEGLINQQIYDPQTDLAVKERAHRRTLRHELSSNQTVMNADKPFTCSKCNVSFRSLAWLRRHSIVHTEPFHCTICDRTFLSSSSLKIHTKMHRKKGQLTAQSSISESKDLSNEGSLVIPSDVCIPRDTFVEQSEASKTSFRECLSVEPTEKVSNAHGLINQQLYDSQTEPAGKEKAYYSSQSPELSSNRTVTNAEKVDGNKPFKCSQCHLSFKTKTWLKRHSLAHTGPLYCWMCDETFLSNNKLQKHMTRRGHHTKGQSSISKSKKLSNEGSLVIPSDVCIPSGRIDRDTFVKQSDTSETSYRDCISVESTEKFSNIHALINQPPCDSQTELAGKEKAYYRTQSPELPSNQTVMNAEKVNGNKPFKCAKCSMSFRSKTWLRRHSIIHTKPFHCRICDKTFLSSSSLKIHTTMHRKKGQLTAQSSISESKDLSNEGSLVTPSDVCIPSVHIDGETFVEQSKISEPSNRKCFTVEPTKKDSHVGGLIHQPIHDTQIGLAVKEKPYHRTQGHELFSKQIVTNAEKIEGKKPFKCAKCNMSFRFKTLLKNHMALHRKKPKRIFKCGECAEVFFSPFAAYKHKLRHKEDNFQCNVCNEPFDTHSEYLSHVNMHKTLERSAQRRKQGKSFTCNWCGKVCSSRISLRKHNKLCHDRKPLECDVCKKLFKYKNAMILHMKAHTMGTTHCQECDVTCTSKREYKQHLKTHPYRRHLKCVLCGAFFLTKHALAGHLMQHKAPKLFKCTQCDKQYTAKRNLDLHILSHSQTKYYKCKECSKKFTSRHTLRTHEGVHFEVKTFHCSICRKGFSTNCGLEGHMKAHRKKFFSCAECDSTFEKSEDLKEHTLTHPKDRSSKCMVCDQLFRATELLRCNLISSAEEAPFECLLCEVCFNNNITNA